MAYAADDVKAETMIGRYKARLLRTESGLKVDVREFIVSPRYTGFTQKGIRLSLEEFRDMVAFMGNEFAKGLNMPPVKAAPVAPKPVSPALPAVNLSDIIEATVSSAKPVERVPAPVPQSVKPADWDKAWAGLVAMGHQKSEPCATCREDWQYMENMEFRHRCGDGHGKRVYVNVATKPAPAAPRKFSLPKVSAVVTPADIKPDSGHSVAELRDMIRKGIKVDPMLLADALKRAQSSRVSA